MYQPSFEWFYIDVHSENGYDLVFTMHTKPFSSVFDITIWDLFVYKDNRLYLHHFFTRPQNQLGRQDQPVMLHTDEHNFLQHNQSGAQLSLSDKEIELDLQLEYAPSPQNEYELLTDPGPERSFRWILYAPYCRARGLLRKANEEIDFTGTAYHDYNSGNIVLKKELKRWYWKKFYFNERLLIYGDIVDRQGKVRRILIEADEKRRKVMNTVEEEKTDRALILKTPEKNWCYQTDKVIQIDDIRFYTTPQQNRGNIFSKMREIAAFVSISRHWLRPLQYIFTNARYKRYRTEGVMNDRYTCSTFHEEMYF